MLRSVLNHLHKVERKRIVMPQNWVLRLNRGERPQPLPFFTQSPIGNALATYLSKLQEYPSYQEFYSKLSNFIGVPESKICVGAGIEEFIRTLMFLYGEEEKIAVLWPTCAMYDIYAEAFGVNLVRIKPEPFKPFSIFDIIKAMPKTTKLLFIPNPGQPVETYFNVVELNILAEHCRQIGAVLVVDEAHYGFGAETALPMVNVFDNVVVLRTFSKFYGAAAIRVGFAVGSENMIKPLHAVRPSGEIAGPSMVIASTLLDHHSFFENFAGEVCDARDWLRGEINRRGYRAWGRVGFSLLVEFVSTKAAVDVGAALAERGILVKSGFPEPVNRCILLSLGDMNVAKKFLEVFVSFDKTGG